MTSNQRSATAATAARVEELAKEFADDLDLAHQGAVLRWARQYAALEEQVEQLREAATNAHGILQVNLGDADPHVRSACDILWRVL